MANDDAQPPEDGYPMADDQIVGDGGNLTIYERPDRSRYALDVKGHGEECGHDTPVFGRARFDSRDEATGKWDGSRSKPEARVDPTSRARSRGGHRLR